MKLLLSLSIILLLGVGCASSSKKSNEESGKDAKQEMKKSDSEEKNVRLTECKSNSDVRSIEIKESDSDAFEVVYTKFGESKSIASGSRAHCEKIRDRVKNNLENAGFTCS